MRLTLALTMSNTITLLVLARENSDHLKRCIESCREQVDHVLIVDTAGAAKVAKEAGAEVEQAKWHDTYDKPLNAGLKKIKSDWILRLEPDEWFESPPIDLRAELKKSEHDALTITRRDYYNDTAWGEQWHLRLWKNDPKMRYEGIINPLFPPKVLASKSVGHSSLRVRFDGFRDNGLRDKLEADLPLLEMEFERDPNLLNYINLLDAQAGTGSAAATEELLKLAYAAIVDEGKYDPEPKLAWLISVAIERLNNFEIATPKAVQFERYAKRWYKDSPMILWALSGLAYRKGFRRQALEHLQQLQELVEKGGYSRATSVPSELIGPALWLRLASIGIELKQNDVALQNLVRLKDAGRADHSVELAIARLQG